MPAKIVIQNVYSRIYGDVPLHIEEAINKELQYKIQNYQQIIEAQAKRGFTTDGVVHLYWPRKGHMFYTGMMSDVLRILDIANFEYEFSDRRIIPERNLIDMKFIPPAWKTERDYQNIIAASMIKAGRGVMQAATGAGKTFITSKIIGSIKSGPFFFFVPSKDLLDQSYDCLSECMNIPIGRIGDGQFDVQQINVATIQTAVKAVNSNNPRFKVSDYKFDDEDDWDADPLDENKSKIIDHLVRSASGIYLDECVCGSTKIVTEKGIKSISDALDSGCSRVMTYQKDQFTLAPITKWWNKGKRKIVRVLLSNGESIRCTPEHLFGTNRGWICAKDLTKMDMVLCANVDAEQFCQKQVEKTGKENTFWDTNAKDALQMNGLKHSQNIYQESPCANADVENLFLQQTKLLNNSYEMVVPKDILNTYGDMTNNQNGTCITLNQQNKKNKLSLVHALEIHASSSRIRDQKIEDCMQTTDSYNSNGSNIKRPSWIDLGLLLKLKKILDMGRCGRQCIQNAYQPSHVFLMKYIKKAKKKLQGNYWNKLETLDLLGGSAMTEVIAGSTCHLPFTPKAGPLKKIILLHNGFSTMECHVQCLFLEKKQNTNNTRIFHSQSNPHSKLPQKYENMSLSAWSTNWVTVTSVVNDGEDDVYDIGVDGTHTFFGNNIFIHNCHHASSKSCQAIMEAASNAYWRYGGSATPFREDGAEKMIQALFGKVVTKVSASWLIRHGYLVKPYIFNIEMTGMHGLFNSYPSVYEHYIVKNDDLNQLVAKLAIRMRQLGVPTLILVQRYNHGDILKKYLPDVPFIKGKMPRKKRKESIASMRDGTLPCAIATTLADEGLDVERLGCVAVAGGGKSITRVYQRVGRALRTFPGKERAIVFLFSHEATFLKTHGETVARILRKEPEFVIINTTEARVMDDLNNLLCPNTAGIFD